MLGAWVKVPEDPGKPRSSGGVGFVAPDVEDQAGPVAVVAVPARDGRPQGRP
jgi:hypothetical protein